MGRIVSIDYGTKRIGLALSDERKIIASPFKVIMAHKNMNLTIDLLFETLKGYDIELIVIGLPLKLNGGNSQMTDEVETFLKLLRERSSCPVITIDERMTSQLADRSLKETSLNRKKRSTIIDAVAASLLLQTYLSTKASC